MSEIFFTTLLQQLMSCFQTASDNPFLRRQIAVLVEIALEGRQAPTGVKRYLSHRHFIHVLLFHEITQNSESQSCFCCRTGLGNNIQDDRLVLDVVENLRNICRGECVTDKDNFCLTVRIHTLDHFDRSSCAKIGTADTADNKYFSLVLYLFSYLENTFKFFLVLGNRPFYPAHEIITGTCSVADCAVQFSYLVLIGKNVFLQESV